MVKVKIVVDSDAIFARYNPHDPLYARATSTFQQLIDKGYQLLYPTSVIFEVVSLFQRVLSNPTVTSLLIKLIKSGQLSVITIDEDILKQSVSLFNPRGSKKNTLVDCSVVAVAKKVKAAGVFAYDEFYRKQGLKLAEDLIEKKENT